MARRRSLLASLAATVLLLLPLLLRSTAAQSYQALCVFTPTTNHGQALNVQGRLSFFAPNLTSQVLVTAHISGNLGTQPYAISINTFGDLTNLTTGSSVGPRFQGAGQPTLGCPPEPNRRAGDLGNWDAVNGVINQTKNIDLLELAGTNNSIVGLSAVLYAAPDNCSNTVDSDAARLAVCVIGISNIDNNGAQNANSQIQNAVAVLGPTVNCNVNCLATTWITFKPQGVEVEAQASGLQISPHGFHIHQYGDLSSNDGVSAGAHWNPNGRNHELPSTVPRHVGDLGNIQSFDTSTGLGWYNSIYTNIPNVYSLLGRTVVIHADIDHGSGAGCDQAGTAGKRLMVGVIGIANTATLPPTVPIAVNNTYANLPCVSSPSPVPIPQNEDTQGLRTGLAIGWVLVGLLTLVVIPGMVAYYWFRLRNSVGGDFYRLD